MSNLIKQIPAKIIAAGPKSAARYVLGTTSMGMFYQSPPIRRAAAEEMILSSIEALVHLPDFISQEQELTRAWSEARPNQFAFAFKDAETIAADYLSISEEDRALRRLIRVCAYRKLDAYQNGSEVFSQTPALAGEPYIEVSIRGTDFKFGLIHKASYTSDATRKELTQEFHDRELIQELERGVFALLPPDTDPAKWAKICRAWRSTMPFREFECSSKLPSFPAEIYFPAKDVPPGYKQRWSEDVLKTCGINVSDATQMGLPMFVSEPGAKFLKDRADAVASLVGSSELAANHMARWLTP